MRTVFWSEAIEKQMNTIQIAFRNLNGVTPEELKKGEIGPAYKYVGLHMILI